VCGVENGKREGKNKGERVGEGGCRRGYEKEIKILCSVERAIER
jgi:hypothetical protein